MGSEPADANAHQPNPTLSRESTTSTITPRTELSWPSTNQATSQPSQTSAASSATPSPLTSREPSPTRPQRSTVPRPTGTRSRKNSQTSPARSFRSAGPTSAPAIKSLSASTTPILPAPANPSNNASMPQKLSSTIVENLKETPRWPVSPRLRSPPPILHKPVLAPGRRLESEAPIISVQRSTPSSTPEVLVDVDSDDSHLQPGTKTPTGRSTGSTSTLETVQEVSPLASPQHSIENAFENLEDSVASETSSQHDSADVQASSLKSRPKLATSESGSEMGSIATERSTSATAPPPPASRQSSTSTLKPPTKGKPGDSTSQSMTVETETVTSIPQVALAQGAGVQGSGGSIRTKPSSETIRPKKEKKKPTRKQPAVTSGTASSKADIFEAKVASAVEEANSSDSEETFVYDSNPPDGRDRPHNRFHSRTPSATSMMSQVDRNGMRSIPGILEAAPPTAGFKKNMKFVNVNTFNSNPNDGSQMEEDGNGTGRSTAGSTRGTARHHHHLGGRYGRRGGGNGHPSLFDDASPFVPGTARSATMANNSRQSSRPTSPRFNYGRSAGNSRRGPPVPGGYDLDDNAPLIGDERTPLLQSPMRSTRSARNRRLPVPLRALEQQTYHQPGSFLTRFASCLVLTVMLLLVVSGAIGFMFATSQPLTDIELTGMRNVLASEQELMLDITVRAHNPNVVVVIIDSADIEVFAKSPHAGTDSEWWRRPSDSGDFSRRRKRESGIGALDDPVNDPPKDDTAPNMRLGTIREFDSPLSFEGSFFHRGVSSSTGEIRLHRPGNGTDGGSERWERIMQDEFDLILKGVLKYSLPLSQRIRSVAISGRTTVKPNSANDPTQKPKNSTNIGFDISVS
ncbi:Vacuolar segregation protein 7 [Coniochaeta hoffmannii]|uniref:Vacuolar segregation protein 7 n=1 Tax=Coniochaeta hoffmannii TaxID=91930 RepID=A0AA38W1S8_9PEZI|nr:Vacuolar segregation protein 7 [Coniochaeta hoffmannii]